MSPGPSSEHVEGSPDLCRVDTVHEFPVNYFVENIAVRRSGELLVSVHNRNELIQVDPKRQDSPAVVVYTFPGGALGIVEVEDDVFYVSSGSIGQKGSHGVFKVNMAPFKVTQDGKIEQKASITKLVDVPDALFLNGSALLDRTKGVILLADSILGQVYSLNVKSSEVQVWVQDKILAKVTDNPMMPGVNGIKVHKGHLYLSNTDAHLFLRIAILDSGAAAGQVEIVADKCNADDFIFDDDDGTAYLTTHTYQSVIRLRADGTRNKIAGGPEDVVCTGTTAAAFGRTSEDRRMLYVTTTGGMSNPINGQVGPGRVLKIAV